MGNAQCRERNILFITNLNFRIEIVCALVYVIIFLFFISCKIYANIAHTFFEQSGPNPEICQLYKSNLNKNIFSLLYISELPI